MDHAIRIYRTGGPEAMIWEKVQVSRPGPGEILLRQTAVGLNYIDIYYRTGLYPAELPFTPGLEGVGIIEELGAGVDGLKVGDRVAYASPPLGAYAERRLMPADRVVMVPDAISDRQAAAMMLKGLTAHYLLRRTYRVLAGEFILVHAATGGVGLILCQWAKVLGAKVIGTVGSEAKAEIARVHGCDYPIVYTSEDFVSKVNELTNGEKVSVVYDSVGKDTFLKSLACLRPMGTMVLFGQSSGAVGSVDLGLLAANSLYLTRPSLMAYTAKRQDLVSSAAELFEVVQGGHVKIEINQTYPLKEVARAHTDLEARTTTGSTILTI
jgi:NADPH:quinone reductase